MSNEILETGHSNDQNSLQTDAYRALCELCDEYQAILQAATTPAQCKFSISGNGKGKYWISGDINKTVTQQDHDEWERIRNEFRDGEVMMKWYKHADNFIKFLDEQIVPEEALKLIRDAIKEPNCLPFNNNKMPHHKGWFKKNANLFLGILNV